MGGAGTAACAADGEGEPAPAAGCGRGCASRCQFSGKAPCHPQPWGSPRVSEGKPSKCSRNAAQSVTGLCFLARQARGRHFQRKSLASAPRLAATASLARSASRPLRGGLSWGPAQKG